MPPDVSALNLTWVQKLSARRHGMLGQLFALMSGTMAAQGLLMLASPVLMRLYEPTDFAALQIYTIWTGIIAAFASGRYELVIMFPEEDGDRTVAASLALAMGTTVCLAVACGFAVWGALALVYPSIPRVNSLVYGLIPIGGLVYAAIVVAQRWEGRKNRFRTIAMAQVAGAIGYVGFQLLFGVVTKTNGAWMILANLIGQFLTMWVLSRTMFREMWSHRQAVTWQAMVSMARRYWRFPVFASSAQLVGRASSELPKLLFDVLFSSQFFGLFSLSLRISHLPLALVGQAFSQVFFKKVVDWRRAGRNVRLLLLRSVGGLLLVITPPMLLLFFFGETLFGTIFGPKWVMSGTIARLLIPLLVTIFVVQPFEYVLHTYEKQYMMLSYQLISVCVTTSAIYLGYRMGNPLTAVLLYSSSVGGMYLIYFALCLIFAVDEPPASTNSNVPEAAESAV